VNPATLCATFRAMALLTQREVDDLFGYADGGVCALIERGREVPDEVREEIVRGLISRARAGALWPSVGVVA
jgi:hypothetical protein